MRHNGGFNVAEPGFEPGAALFLTMGAGSQRPWACLNLRGQAGFACREPSINKIYFATKKLGAEMPVQFEWGLISAIVSILVLESCTALIKAGKMKI